MPFEPAVKTAMFIRCNRRCCLCLKQCGINIEVAHIIDEAAGGSNDEDNGIPLCFDCHQEIGSYNDKHPRGNKFRSDELRARRDRVFALVAGGRVDTLQPVNLLDQKLSDGWTNVLPDELKPLINLELGTPPQITRNIAQSDDGQFWLVYWDSSKCQYKWEKVTEEYASAALQPVARYRNMDDWRELLKERRWVQKEPVGPAFGSLSTASISCGTRLVYYKGVQYRFLNFGGKNCRIEPIVGGQSFLAPTHELFHDPKQTQRITRDSIVVRA